MKISRIRPRSGRKTDWETANPILLEREIGYEYPNGGIGSGPVKMKMGDGVTPWNDLPYAIPEIVNDYTVGDPKKIAGAEVVKKLKDELSVLDNLIFLRSQEKDVTFKPGVNEIVFDMPFQEKVNVGIFLNYELFSSGSSEDESYIVLSNQYFFSESKKNAHKCIFRNSSENDLKCSVTAYYLYISPTLYKPVEE